MKLLLIVCLLASALTQTPEKSNTDLLRASKTICVQSPEGVSLDMKAEIVKKLNRWGKLQVVSTPEMADLILKIEQTRSFSGWKGKGARGAAVLTHRESGRELWATSEGGDWSMSGYSNGKVGRKIASKFVKYYEREVR